MGFVLGNIGLDKLDKGHFDGIMGGSRSLMGHEKEMEARVHEF